MIAAFGREQCLNAWAEEIGLHPVTLTSRLRKGWEIESALTTPTISRKLLRAGRPKGST